MSHKEEPSKTESELTRCLSDLYLRKSREESVVSNQEDSKKKRMHVERVFFETVYFKSWTFPKMKLKR